MTDDQTATPCVSAKPNLADHGVLYFNFYVTLSISAPSFFNRSSILS